MFVQYKSDVGKYKKYRMNLEKINENDWNYRWNVMGIVN